MKARIAIYISLLLGSVAALVTRNKRYPTWMIYFKDRDVSPEIYTGYEAERIARHRFKELSFNWTCTLFREVLK